MEAVSYHRQVNYYETDQMGIVHHSNYIRYFEEARMDMMDQLGMGYAGIEQAGLLIPVLFVDCQYLQPLRYGDQFVISTRMTKFDGIKMEIAYEIHKENGKLLCTTGHSGHCFLDKEMKPVRMKRYYPEIYTKLKEMV
ncbi:MAG: acyl-CoA thioesterase [Lachnospiraceae bacterium]|nr:acyl-CoA thioesterase [Lachnospiraceae bacterium]